MGTDAGIAILKKSDEFKTETFGRFRVFKEAYTEHEYRSRSQMVELLKDCLKYIIDDYEDDKDLEEFNTGIFWINKCIDVLIENGEARYSIFADTDDYERGDFK